MKWFALSPVLLAAPVAMAASSGSTLMPVDVSAKVATCQGCHGMDGIATLAAAPNLAGQKAAYLEAQLRAFRTKERKNDLMNAIAGQLGDDEIKALATYWAGRPAGGTMDGAARRSGAIKTMVTFPERFPDGFVVYRTDEDLTGKTIVRDWANRPAFDAARAGKPLPESGVIVAETTAAHEEGGKLVSDGPMSYAVFSAGPNWGAAIPELLRNGNWQFGIFGADRTPRLGNQAACLACHKPQAAQSFMFTYDALAAKARE